MFWKLVQRNNVNESSDIGKASLPALEGAINAVSGYYGPKELMGIKYTLKLPSQTAMAYLESLKNVDAAGLRQDWNFASGEFDFDRNISEVTECVLFLNSNNKSQNTQGENFESAGLQFADDVHATLICATLINEAIEAGVEFSWKPAWNKGEGSEKASSRVREEAEKAGFSKEKIELLSRLAGGIIRTRSNGLGVLPDGRLRACGGSVSSNAYEWAVGSQ